MPQSQRRIELTLLGGSSLQVAANGNNAAWNCHCGGHPFPLIGKSGKIPVECPACHRQYVVVPEGRPLSSAVRVEEIRPG